MKTIGDILNKTKEALETKKRIGPNSERADIVLQLVSFMGEDRPKKNESEEATQKRVNGRIKYWLGRTRKLTPGGIHGLMKSAKDGRNPRALFNWLLKKENEKK